MYCPSCHNLIDASYCTSCRIGNIYGNGLSGELGVECLRCNGEGNLDHEFGRLLIACPSCNGTGWIRERGNNVSPLLGKTRLSS